MKRIYLDNASTTPIIPEVVEVMMPYLSDHFGNPSAKYLEGRNARMAVENARKQIALCLSTHPSQIIFTSGGTEANNLALRGVIKARKITVVISSPIEHASVLKTLYDLSSAGFVKLQMVDITIEGIPDYCHLERLLQANTDENILVSLMHGNNEIGSVIDLELVGKLSKQYRAYFHTNAVQTIAYYSMDLSAPPFDLLTASAHKFHGPKGVGFLWVKKDLGLYSIQTGGSQENGMRAGTEQVAGIVGMAKALRLSMECYPTAIKHIQQLNIQLCDGLTRIGGKVNGMKNAKGLCSLVNMQFENNLQSQNLLMELDSAGISVGSSVAATIGVSSKIGVKIISDDFINIRFSFSRLNNSGEIFRVLSIVEYQLNGNAIWEQALTI